MSEEIPDKNIFMMCPSLNRQALSELHSDFYIRNCREEEFAIWRDMPFDNPAEAVEYRSFMENFFETTYGHAKDLFYESVLFVCNKEDQPIATCFLWKAYGKFTTVQWLKVVKGYEGLGIGRALLSILFKDLAEAAYPVYLHTQPGSYRAIKLYSDFGFQILTDATIGSRSNDWEECMPILAQYMPPKDFKELQLGRAPTVFLDTLALVDTIEF